MVVTRISDGLGNQLFQYAAGLALATRLQTTLSLDASLLAKDPFRCFGLHHFNVRGHIINRLQKMLIRVSTTPRLLSVRSVIRCWLPKSGYHYFRDRESGYDSIFETLQGNVYLDGYWQSEKYFAGIAETLRQDFTFKNLANDQNRQVMLRIASAPAAVCVHVRRGDYLSNPSYRAKYHFCGLGYYQRAMQVMRTQVENPSYFVFSDDPDWAKVHLPMEGSTEYITFNVGQQDYDDLRLMIACRHFIIANSTFSWWGAWLCAGTDKIVIAPRQWFATERGKTDDLIPNSWILL